MKAKMRTKWLEVWKVNKTNPFSIRYGFSYNRYPPAGNMGVTKRRLVLRSPSEHLLKHLSSVSLDVSTRRTAHSPPCKSFDKHVPVLVNSYHSFYVVLFCWWYLICLSVKSICLFSVDISIPLIACYLIKWSPCYDSRVRDDGDVVV